jgi:hypothetical protein
MDFQLYRGLEECRLLAWYAGVTRCKKPVDGILHSHRRVNLKSYILGVLMMSGTALRKCRVFFGVLMMCGTALRKCWVFEDDEFCISASMLAPISNQTATKLENKDPAKCGFCAWNSPTDDAVCAGSLSWRRTKNPSVCSFTNCQGFKQMPWLRRRLIQVLYELPPRHS